MALDISIIAVDKSAFPTQLLGNLEVGGTLNGRPYGQCNKCVRIIRNQESGIFYFQQTT